MRVVRSAAAMRALARRWRRRGLSIGFVPTMGALHEGHLSLVRRSKRRDARTVVSIFVNPLQFGPKEDLSRYPRPAARDRALCAKAGVDALYLPSAAAMVPAGSATRVSVEGLSDRLCGEFRPGHFQGVATVVLKLFEAVEPDRAYFGEKDFQQLVIVRRMARDLDVPVEVAGCPTVREENGLALSSRNAYLTPAQRARAPLLYRALRLGAREARRRGATPASVEAAARRELDRLRGARPDYVALVDAATLERPGRLKGRLRLLAAVRLGRARLIDNVPVILGGWRA